MYNYSCQYTEQELEASDADQIFKFNIYIEWISSQWKLHIELRLFVRVSWIWEKSTEISTNSMNNILYHANHIGGEMVSVWDQPVYYSQTLLNYLAFQYFDIERTWWRLFQRRVVRTKLDIYGFFLFRSCSQRLLNY